MKTKFKIIFATVAVLVSVTMLAAFIIIEQQTEKKQITEPEVSKTEELNEKITSIEETVSTEETVKAEESSTVKTEKVISSTPAEQTQSQSILTKKEPEKIKTVTIQGEKITAEFVKERIFNNKNSHSEYCYENSNGTKLDFDSVTNQLLYMWNNESSATDTKFSKKTEKEIVAIAEAFIKENGLDLSRYTLEGCKYDENSNWYGLHYSWTYNNYSTADYIAFYIEDSGKITYFSCNPYVFDNVKMLPIDEEFLTKQLNEAIAKFKSDHKYNYTDNYDIISKYIRVNDDNELVMSYKINLFYNTTAKTSVDNVEKEVVRENLMTIDIDIKIDKTSKAPSYEIGDDIAMSN